MPRPGRIAFRALTVLAVLSSASPLRAAEEASGTFVVDGQTTILRHGYAVQERDPRDPGAEYLTLVISDVPVAEADRIPARLQALAQAGRLHAVKVRWSVGLDETAAIPYHAALRNSGQASAGNLVLDLRAYDGQRVEAHVRSRMVGQNWQYSARVKAAIQAGGAAELEPDAEPEGQADEQAPPEPAGAPANRKLKLELGKLGYEFNEDMFAHAVKDGNLAAVRLFLEAGMSPDAKDAQGEHVLVRAVTFCAYPPAADRTQVALALIAAKADVHARMNGYEAVPIWAAEHCQAEVVAALIAVGANVNARAPGGATPLMMARMRGERGIVAMLQKAGAKDEGPAVSDSAPPAVAPRTRPTPAPRATATPTVARPRTRSAGVTDRPPQADPAEAQRRLAERLAWFRQHTVEAYAAGGHTDARWDAAAREALEAAWQSWSQSPERPGNDEERAWRASERALKAGCDDPLVLYVNARFYAVAAFDSAEEAARRLRAAATGLRDSRYAPYFKAIAQMRLAETMVQNPVLLVRGPAEAQAALQAALALLPEVARDRHVPEPSLVSFVHALSDVARALQGDRSAKRILAAFEAPQAADSRLPMLRAALLTDSAWDERGNKNIEATSEAQSEGFARRMDEAEQQLALALAADPGNPALPLLAMALELGQGRGRERMEAWYQHGLRVDPGSYELRAAKLHYLEPHWYGSADEMLAFAQEQRAAGQWALRLPLVLVAAHFELAIESKDREAYWAAHPQACQDVRSVFAPFLERYPEAAYERSGFAAILCSCGAWADAQRQFELLGDDARTGPFFGRAGLSLKQAEAARRAQPRPRRR